MGICISPTISISYFFLAVGRGIWKLPIVIVGGFSITLIPFTWNCFFGKCTICALPLIWKVTLLLLQSIKARTVFKKGLPRIIDMLSSSGISSITKSDSNICNNNGHILRNTDRYGSWFVSHLQRYFSRCEFIQVKYFI